MIVISNGMMRSGSTLQYNMAASVLAAAGSVTRVGFLGNFGNAEVRAKLESIRDSNGSYILKTHEAPLEYAFYDDRVKVLFSYRDLRDIAASMKKKWDYPFEKIIADIDAMIEIEHEFKAIPNVLYQAYDKLYAHPEVAASEIANHLQIELCKEDYEKISTEHRLGVNTLKHSSTSNFLQFIMNKLGKKRFDKYSLLHNDHISASGGKDGDWVNVFSYHEIQIITDRYSDWLVKRGYSLNKSEFSKT